MDKFKLTGIVEATLIDAKSGEVKSTHRTTNTLVET
jgi:hypothetical protein